MQVFPTSNVGYLLATFEQLLGILINVFVFAAVLAKFQSPQADLIFSKQACVFTRDSVRFLCIRVGNLRCHCLFNPTIKLYLLQDRETAEGESFITIKQLSVDEPGTISGVYNITHKIDSKSPLFALSEKEIKSGNRNIALQCVFSALDPVYQAEVCSKSSYGMDSIKFGVRFEDMVQVGEDGRPALDFAYFEELISVPEYWEWEDQRLHASEMDNSEAPISFSQSLCLVVGYGRSSYADPFLDGDLPLSGMRAECVFTLSIAMMLAEAQVEYEEYRCDLGDKPDWLKEVNPELQTPACRLARSKEWLNGTDHIFDCLRETIPRVSELFEVELPPNVKDDKDYYDPMRLAFSLSLAHANRDCKMRSFLFDKSGISPELGGKESESILREKCLEKLHRWEASLRGIGNESNLYLCGDKPGHLDLILAPKLYLAFQLFESGLANLGEGKSFQEAAPLCFEYLRRMEKRESWKKAFGPGYEIASGRLHVPMLRVLCNKFVAMCPELNDTVTLPALQKARKTNHERNLYLCGDRPAYLDMQLASKLYFAFQLFESGMANLGKSFQEAAPLCFDYLRRMEKRESWKKAFGPGYEVSLGRLHVPMLRVLCKKFVAMCPEINDTVTIPALEKARRTKLVRTKSQNSESSLGKKVVSATLCL